MFEFERSSVYHTNTRISMTMSRRQTNNTSYRCGSFENYAVAVHSPIGSPPAGDDDSDYLPSDVSLSSEDTPYRLNTNLRSISRQPHNVIEISSSEEEDSVHSLNDSTATGRPLDQVSKSNDDSLRVLPTSTRMEIFPENHPQAPPAASDYSTGE